MTCETCGQRVRVEGHTTKHYVGVDAEDLAEIRKENIFIVNKAHEVIHIAEHHDNGDTDWKSVRQCIWGLETLLRIVPETSRAIAISEAERAVVTAAKALERELGTSRLMYGPELVVLRNALYNLEQLQKESDKK